MRAEVEDPGAQEGSPEATPEPWRGAGGRQEKSVPSETRGGGTDRGWPLPAGRRAGMGPGGGAGTRALPSPASLARGSAVLYARLRPDPLGEDGRWKLAFV